MLNLPLIFWLNSPVLGVIFFILWAVLPLYVIRRSKEGVNYPQLASDLAVCAGCVHLSLYAIYTRYHSVVSSDIELTIQANFMLVNLCIILLVAWIKKDKGVLAPLLVAGYCMFKVGKDGYTGVMVVPFLASSGINRSICRVLFSSSKFANAINLVVFLIEVLSFVGLTLLYCHHLPKGNRSWIDSERLIGWFVIPWFYTGRLNHTFQAMDRSIVMVEDKMIWLPIANAQSIHSAIVDKLHQEVLLDKTDKVEQKEVD